MLIIHPSPAEDGKPLPSLKEAVWIDLIEPTEEEMAAVAEATGLKPPTRDQLSEVESSSRLRTVGDALYLSTPLLAGAAAAKAELSPVGFIINPRVLVTVRFTQFSSFDHVAEEAAITPLCQAGIFVQLIEAVVDRAADLLEHVGTEVERLSHSAFSIAEHKGKSRQGGQRLRLLLARVGRLGQRLSHIRGVLLGVGRIAPYAAGVGQQCLAAEFRQRLSVVSQDVASLDDYEGHLGNKLQFLLDAVLGLINAEQNDLFKILTIVSVVGVPPTLVASIYGMNFHHMPELEWPWGYPFGLAMIAASTLLPILWFKWRRWW